MKNIALCVIILCVVSFCVGLPFAEAHRGTRDENNALETAKEDLTPRSYLINTTILKKNNTISGN